MFPMLSSTGYTQHTRFGFPGFVACRPNYPVIMIRSILACLLTFAVQSAHTQPMPLQLDSIMQGDRYVGPWPESPWWSPDSKRIHFKWNPNNDLVVPLYEAGPLVDVRPLSWKEEAETPPARLVWNSDHTKAAYLMDGDLYLWDASARTSRRVTTTVAREENPLFARGDSVLVYGQEGQLFAMDLYRGHLRQLTDLRKGKQPSEARRNDRDKYLYQDQERLFYTLSQNATREQARKAYRDSLRSKDKPKTIWLDEKTALDLRVDPTLRYITWRQVSPGRTESTMVPDMVTRDGYTSELKTRPKVGEEQPEQTFHCFDLSRDTSFQITLDSLPGIYAKPEFNREYHTDTLPYRETFDKPRPVIIHPPVWSVKGLAVMEIRAADNKDRWIVRFDPETMRLICMDHQRDSAWIGGPGISGWAAAAGNLGWLGDGETFWFQSEESGYSHLYSIHIPSNRRRALTSGSFEVMDASLSRNGKTFFLRANAEGPFEQHFYHLSAMGGPLRRITREAGAHEVSVSPDERWLAIRHSSSNRPWDLYLMENKPGATMRRITHSPRREWAAYPWREPEIVLVPASDGAMVPARLYRPDPAKANGAGVIFVHGAGYLQNVHRWWSTYYREYMFHNLLCDEGYTVLDMDYRASSGYGRDWRTAIYRHMGGRDLQDHLDGARYLVDELGVFKERIGIYGGSYGGFITLMALFRAPGVFACGAALRAVTDWAHYNHPYTANILNTPATDSLSYRRSSPIEFAEGLQDPLLILHGMVDVNVHFQDVVRLSQRLIELGKKDWDMAIYPVEDHGFSEPSSWVDEYRRIYRHFQTYLR